MRDLVYDVGMHNGDDTAYYLARGYRVVSVEANPIMCESAQARFSREVESGQLTILNVGVAEAAGELDFWVSSHSEWSSFHEDHATMAGQTATRIAVATKPFRQIMEEEGVPFFVKIDIEMNDHLCLQDLAFVEDRPQYLSFESNVEAERDIKLLESLGYESFKCVRQNDLREINPRNVVYQEEACGLMRRLDGLSGRANIVPRGFRRVHYRKRPVNGWRFATGSSGPLGIELPGKWLTTDQILSVWHQLIAYDLRLQAAGLGEWFDIHAAYGTVA